MTDPMQKIAAMTYWKSDIEVSPISGGITNQNFLVIDNGQKYFVRIGEDILLHGVMRFNELAASRAAYKAGISPEVLHAQTGIMVLPYIDAEALSKQQIRAPHNQSEIIQLIRACHYKIPKVLSGPTLAFWVFQVLRNYAHSIQAGNSQWQAQLSSLMKIASQLEAQVGEIELVFGHNDLLAANFMDDGDRLWLIDWDYAGFNSPLFDLGGLASNNEFSPQQELSLLTEYFGAPPDNTLLKKYSAMKCASLLRETLWSMVSEIHSSIEFDYQTYTQNNLALFNQSWEAHQQSYSL